MSVSNCSMNGAAENSRCAPADSITTCLRDGAVKIRMEDKGPASVPPITVMQLVKETVDRVPGRPALAAKVDGTWKMMNYEEYYANICCAARAFIKLELEPTYSVAVIGFNSPEYFIANLATIFAGGIATGIYTTNSPEACHYILDNADCQFAFAENETQMNKILQVRDRLPRLKGVVQYKGQPTDEHRSAGVLSWEEFISLGKGEDKEQLELELGKRIAAQAPNKCCTLIYTSGTTGDPKGVMASHDNITWTSKTFAKFIGRRDGERVISYLPLSHLAGQFSEIYTPMVAGNTVYFAQPDALKGSLKTTILEVRPTTFLAVPRVFEKFQEAMTAAGKNSGFMQRTIVSWAKDIGLRSTLADMQLQPRPWLYPLAKALVFDKVRAALGLDECYAAVSSAAPITKETLEFFACLDIRIFQVYGQSECSGPHTATIPDTLNVMSSVGREFPGAQTKLVDADRNIVEEGQICIYGRHVFMGYLNMPDKTSEVFDDEGWLLTGDTGKKDENGLMFITGRIKELIITAGGENIPPVLIEDQVKLALPCISNCMLIGDKRKFLSMLLTPKVEMDPETNEPTEKLSGATIDWCRSLGSSATVTADMVKDPQVLEAIQKGIDAANKKATSRAQCIQKWKLLSNEFSITGGELGPTLKLRRHEILKIYAKTIDAFYEETGTSDS